MAVALPISHLRNANFPNPFLTIALIADLSTSFETA